MPHVDGAAHWSSKACKDGWKVAYICKDTSSCYDPIRQWHWGLFEHIGLARVPAALDARSQGAAAAVPAENVVAASSVSFAAGFGLLQQLPHVEIMSTSSWRTGSSIVVAAAALRQRQVLAGKKLGSTNSSSWA
jgi:hypothetical protein